VELNSNKVKSMRASKGWTQQHLADACGLSLRTIQRVERHGAGSQETALSICSVFEVDIYDIQIVEPEAVEGESINIHQLAMLLIPTLLFGAVSGAALTYFFIG